MSETRAAIGGWFSAIPNPCKDQVQGLAIEAYGAKEADCSLEFMLAARQVCNSKPGTDKEGNAFAASNRAAKKWPCSALVVELSARETNLACRAKIEHVKQCSNSWVGFLRLRHGERCDVLYSFSRVGWSSMIAVSAGAYHHRLVATRLIGVVS